MSPKVALIVNAGGSSQRMGRDKALLRVPGSNLTLVEHIIRRLLSLVTDRVFVVENGLNLAEQIVPELRIHFVGDIGPNLGPLGGLIPALELCEEWALVVACDMPRVQTTVFELLWATMQLCDADEADAVVPIALGRIQPFFALYHKRCSAPFQSAVDQGRLSLRGALRNVKVRYIPEVELKQVDPILESFININTPDEWEAYIYTSDIPKQIGEAIDIESDL